MSITDRTGFANRTGRANPIGPADPTVQSESPGRPFFTLQESPSWLVSLVIHVAVILMLALIPLSGQLKSSISIFLGNSDEFGSDDMSVVQIQPEPSVDSDAASLEVLPTLNDLVMSEIAPKLDANPEISIELPIRNGLRGRTGPMKEALLKAYGGTRGTEDAVAAGLEWLARNQKSDGSWSLVGSYTDGGTMENKPAATAMALLAFMGAGNTHKTGTYQDRVRKGIDFLIKIQNRDGFFADQAAGNQRTYAHAQAAIAICELYGMTGDESLREPAQKSVKYNEKSQSKNGGWRYQPKEGGDTSVTGWYVMALISARMAGLDVDSECLERVHRFLDSVQRQGRSNRSDPDGERYAYQSYTTPTPSMTAEGMLCRLYLGWETNDSRIARGAEYLLGNPIEIAQDRISYYYWYYATTTIHHIGGPAWTEWNNTMKTELPRMQLKTGKERGSWPPEEDPHSGGGGRLYATCFAIYCLESYYRHLPLSEMASKP
ncbi:MAG: prenyltransferase/squalene oxidase repeat-containing protein [Pirellula sp.]